jgi:2-oxoglutarate ferredoxin oxidoreductase subunit beta
VARGIDTQQKPLVEILKAARAHRGAAFVEILQNCIVYNDDVFANITARDVAADAQLWVEHGQPLRFGPNRGRGLRLKPGALALEPVSLGEDGITEADLLVHDARNPVLAAMLAALAPPAMPMAFGVLYDDPAPPFELAVARIDADARADLIAGQLRRGETWTVDGTAG